MSRTRYLIALLSVFACSPPAPPPAPRPFTEVADPAEYAPFQEPGDYQLSGQAFLTTRGGDVKLGAGRLVTLDPATTYAREWFRRFGAALETFEVHPSDPDFIEARRTTTTNAEGRFSFSGLPKGDYLVRTTVTWEVAGDLQGGVVAKIVSVGERADTEVILSEVATPDLAATLGISLVGEAELRNRPHMELGPVEGVSCQDGLAWPEPTEEEAREEILINAAGMEADAIANLSCRKAGLSFTCVSRFVCEGTAIRWMIPVLRR